MNLTLEESANENDMATEIEGVTFLVDENQAPYCNRVKLDYRKNMIGMGEFRLLNV